MSELFFDTREAGQAALDLVNAQYKAQLIAAGAILDEQGNIVPINAGTGEPDYAAVRTVFWDELRETEDGRFAFFSLD